jgi:PAS domain S-box-containing protein
MGSFPLILGDFSRYFPVSSPFNADFPGSRDRVTGYIQALGQPPLVNDSVTNPPARPFEALASLAVALVFFMGLWLVPAQEVMPLYVVGILLAMWSERPKLGYLLAALSTFGILITASQDPQAWTWPHVLGEVVAAGACWAAAFVVVRYRRGGLALAAAQKALGRSVRELEHMKYALDQSAIVSMTDVTGTITYVNDKFCEVSGYGREELIGRNHRLLNSGYHSIEFFKSMYRAISAGQVWRDEIRNRAKDGSLYWMDTTIVPWLDDRGRPQQYIALRYDITERKESEAALRAQTALVQLGKMAAIVAHEVRNPLAGIRGAMQVIGRRLPSGSPEQGIANEAITRIDTLNDIVQDLLLFARPRQPLLETVDVSTLLANTVSLLREDPRFNDVRIVIEEAAGQKVLADQEQIKLVLINLLINSAQAMDGTGTITVQARNVGGWEELRIIDQGAGIPPEIQEHLFEPFFTTKHRGTGLGLPTARRILEGHGGSISLDCPPGGGTVAIVRLPLR